MAGEVAHRDFVLDQGLQRLRAHLHVADHDDLPQRVHGHFGRLLAVLFDDEVFAALPDVATGFVDVQHRPVVARRHHPRELRRGAGERGHVRLGDRGFDLVEGFFGQTHRRERAAEAAVAQLRGQRRRGTVARGKFPAKLDRAEGFRPQFRRELDRHPLPSAGVELVAARHRRPLVLLQQQGLGAQLHRVVVPDAGLAVLAGRPRAVLGLDGVRLAALLLQEVKHAANAERVRRQRHAPRALRPGLGSGARLEFGVVHAAVVEQPALDVLVGRHHAIDVLQVVQARAVRRLVQGADGDQLLGDGTHGRSSGGSWGCGRLFKVSSGPAGGVRREPGRVFRCRSAGFARHAYWGPRRASTRHTGSARGSWRSRSARAGPCGCTSPTARRATYRRRPPHHRPPHHSGEGVV